MYVIGFGGFQSEVKLNVFYSLFLSADLKQLIQTPMDL